MDTQTSASGCHFVEFNSYWQHYRNMNTLRISLINAFINDAKKSSRPIVMKIANSDVEKLGNHLSYPFFFVLNLSWS